MMCYSKSEKTNRSKNGKYMDKTKKTPHSNFGGVRCSGWGLAGGGCGHRAGSLSCLAGAGHPGTLVWSCCRSRRFWQRIGFQRRAHPAGASGWAFCPARCWPWPPKVGSGWTPLAPVMQLVKATPVASFIILALVWVSGRSLSILISFLMVLPSSTAQCAPASGVHRQLASKWRRCSVCLWGGSAGRCGCLRCCRPSGRDAAWPLVSAGKAA